MFQDDAACEEGFRCEEGFCLNRCAIAERTGSYIGCEYWAVELENHLLYTDETGQGRNFPPDESPPFAVVLANTSSTYDASISVFASDTVPAVAVKERLVRTNNLQPGTDLVTVRSELVDGEGNQVRSLEGPIENFEIPRGHIMTLILPHKRMPGNASSLTKVSQPCGLSVSRSALK